MPTTQLVRLVLVFFATAMLACVRPASAGNGALDPTFGTGGRTFTNIGVGANRGATSVALQADGKIVVVANNFLVSRYNADGTLDTSFNGTGRVVTPGGSAFVAAIQPDGKIVVAGAGVGYTVLRLLPDGTPDAGFGVNGRATMPVGGGGAPYDVRIQADGRIVMAGLTYTSNSKAAFAVVRLNADGSADTTFNGQGTLVESISAEGAVAFALGVQPDGKIVVAGYTVVVSPNQTAFALLRLMPDGSRDPSFGNAGVATTSFPAPGSGGSFLLRAELGSMALQSDGKIAVSGFVDELATPGVRSPVVARYNADGTLDTTFNGSGFVVTPFSLATDYYSRASTAIAAQADGKLVVATAAGFSGSKQCALARYLPSGSLDSAFNGSGTRLESATLPCDLGVVALQSDGKVVSGGQSNGRLVVFRHLASGSADGGFGSAGYVRAVVSFSEDYARGVALQADGRIVTAGGFPGLGSPHVLTRHTSGGILDPSFGSDGIAFYSSASSMTLGAMALDSAGRILTAGSYYTPCAGHTCLGNTTLTVARASADGTAYSTFGSAGVGSGLERNSTANAIAIQADGRVVAAGSTDGSQIFSPRPSRIAVARFTAGGALDTSFNGTGTGIAGFSTDDRGHGVALHTDGRIVIVGKSKSGTQYDLVVVRYTANGAFESVGLWDIGAGADDSGQAVAVQADGMILVGGSTGTQGFLARFSAPGTYDATFANGGKRIVAGAIVALVLQADGKIVALTSGFDVLRFLPSGAPDATFGQDGRLPVLMGAGAVAAALAIQPDGRIVVAGTADAGFGSDFALARIDPSIPAPLAAAPERLDFGGQSINTTSPALSVTITNGSGSTLTVASVTASAGYTVLAHNCASLAAAATCLATVEFTPPAEGSIPGTLTVAGDKGSISVGLEGVGERSLVTHYYRSILRRAPDAGGKAFWLAEAARVTGLGAGVNEVWFAMAMQFYFSAEYAAFNSNDSAFVTDLYTTFFNRAPDTGGLAFWVANLAQGMPREVLLAQFMFSTEFRLFTQLIFGTASARAEVNTVVDFYRGLLARTPDSTGFNFWVSRFRSAQCLNSDAVAREVESISSLFVLGAEYSNRNRTNAQYVGDLYNAFLRRGGDLQGVQHWIGQLNSGAVTREQLRVEFKGSAEFQARVNAIIQQGCMQ